MAVCLGDSALTEEADGLKKGTVSLFGSEGTYARDCYFSFMLGIVISDRNCV